MKNKKMHVLIVDDNPQNLKVLGNILKDNTPYGLAFAMSGKEALEYLVKNVPDMVLLDVMMPDMDGFEVCKTLHARAETKGIPVIFITAKSEPEDIVKGFQMGGVDYVTKPFNEAELLMRINTHMELKRARDLLEEKNKELIEAYDKIEHLALTDTLTGIANRRNITNMLGKEAARCKRNKGKFSLIMCDIDFFKRVNDTYGHDAGDYVLKTISHVIQQALREQDIVARWGGEEFLIVLPETDAGNAVAVAEKLRTAIGNTEMSYEGISFSVTMTFGVSEYDVSLGIEKSIKKADDALYEGKQTGRNKVVRSD
ncbi:response regulator receiver modulated diguanylate cyclase [Denitrovibrio acetiphilus DSM 12809]|uniref:diguanylate cyclase n=1 Tax=Denitrovibrio acetiphilus (strain DSM 12809 / NBRC 114555 / N2460) TaxID=522772 RepID=D4H5P1_DENA2|nr:PleD family two-component system response regulator [Denitrovibrio acetiphilus]ADD69482.1 response regulator receiver modulated diguanylate cyclase [Denitrovibrio acetiphilus DSM 12809]